MLNPTDLRQALTLVTSAAVADTSRLLAGGDPRAALVEAMFPLVAYYADGSAALAADHYDELRDAATPRRPFTATPVVNLDEERLRRAALWAADPLYLPEPDRLLAESRVAEVVQLEVAQPFRDTITENQRTDPDAVGYRRNASLSGCKFCRMLAGRGSVYREATAHFASHPHCHCTASPVFSSGSSGPEASTMQYVASKRERTPREQAALRDYLARLPD